MPNGYLKKAIRGSRTVVLPDYQGLGIGSALSNFIASCYKKAGYRYFVKTVNPALGEYRMNHSEMWKPTAKNKIKTKDKGKHSKRLNWSVSTRASYCHEYIGDCEQGDEKLVIDEYKFEENNFF